MELHANGRSAFNFYFVFFWAVSVLRKQRPEFRLYVFCCILGGEFLIIVNDERDEYEHE